MREDLINVELFGNEAGEDEDKKRLSDYYLEKEEYSIFYDKNRNLEFVRARKGVGKSALINYSALKVEERYPDDIVINIKATELISLVTCDSIHPLEYTNCWQQRICIRILNELAKNIKFAFTDDSMRIIENSEIMGFKGRNIISALIDRMEMKIGDNCVGLKNKDGINNGYELLRRYSQNQSVCVWLFIDDIDATFINSVENMIMVGTFFSACRYLVNSVQGLNIRASVRTDVWTVLKNNDEALDKCEQYMLDLVWSTRDTGKILYKKIYSYFTQRDSDLEKEIGGYDFKDNHSQVFDLVFKGKLGWGCNRVDPYRSIHILSAGRPRWAAQLCKLAAKDAYNKNKDYIGTGNINYAMKEYGKYRMADLYKEHKHQCNELEAIIEIFRNGKRAYSSPELLEIIEQTIIKGNRSIYIDDKNEACDQYRIAKFLYRIGFITLRNDDYNKALGLTRFEDDPYLFSEYNIDSSQIWEIHPAYRTVLKIH